MALFGAVKSLGKGMFNPGMGNEDELERMRLMAEALGRQGGAGDLGGQKSGVQSLIDLTRGADPRGGPWTMSANAASAAPMAGGGAQSAAFMPQQLTNKAGPYDPLAGAPRLSQDNTGLDRYISSTSDAMKQLPTNVPREATRAIQPKFLERGGAGGRILKGLGEMALAYSAGEGNQAALMTLQNREWARRQQLLNQREDMLHARDQNAPQYFMSGEDRYRYDPSTGKGERIVDAPHAFEEYAAKLGYEPGTPEFNRAVNDYVLRASGPTATDNDIQLEGVRQQGRTSLEGVRQRNRVDLRGIPQTRIQAPPRTPAPSPNSVIGGVLRKVAEGAQLSTGEQSLYTRWQQSGAGRGAAGRGNMQAGGANIGGGLTPPRGGGGYQRGQTATDPKTGKRKMFNGTTWVDIS